MPAGSRGVRAGSLLGMLPHHWLIFWRMSRPLVAFIRSAEIDIVHTVLPNSYLVGGIACAVTRRRLVMSRVSLNSYQDTYPVYKLLERALMHRIVRIAFGDYARYLGSCAPRVSPPTSCAATRVLRSQTSCR